MQKHDLLTPVRKKLSLGRVTVWGEEHRRECSEVTRSFPQGLSATWFVVLITKPRVIFQSQRAQSQWEAPCNAEWPVHFSSVCTPTARGVLQGAL